MRLCAYVLILLLAACGGTRSRASDANVVATFSIVAFDPETGDLGVAVQSKFFGVGAVVPYVRADVGAIATQALANPEYGPQGLDLMDDGMAAPAVVERITAADAGRDRRQVGVVDAEGRAAAYTGKRTFAWAGHRVGENYCCQGNILAGKKVVDAMAETFETARGPLAERLVEALRAGQAAGGDKRGRQSAALVVARRGGGFIGGNDRYLDVRVDDHPTPIEELARLLAMRRKALPDSPVPEKFKGLVREARVAPAGQETARAVWETWKRLRRVRDLRAIWLLCNENYREEHSLKDLERAEAVPNTPQTLAERGHYVGTGVKDGMAHLFFAVPGRKETVMLLLVREKGHWRIVP